MEAEIIYVSKVKNRWYMLMSLGGKDLKVAISPMAAEVMINRFKESADHYVTTTVNAMLCSKQYNVFKKINLVGS